MSDTKDNDFAMGLVPIFGFGTFGCQSLVTEMYAGKQQ